MRKLWGWGVMGAVLLAAPWAQAHELDCEKTVAVYPSAPGVMTNGWGGSTFASVDTYPATALWKLKVLNTHDTSDSIVLGASDPVLEKLGFSFYPAPPFVIPFGESKSDKFEHGIESYEHCLYLAKLDGYPDRFIDNVFTVTWDDDSASCSARIECEEEEEEGEEGATRTQGFWSTHVDAMTACLGTPIDPIDLGIVSVDSLADAFGIFWGSTSHFPPGPPTGAKRSDVDQKRFILMSQLLAAICNERVFGTTPTPASLFDDARAALADTDCEDITDIKDALDDFNNEGDDEPFPEGISFGNATPQVAKNLAVDPTTPSGEVCE